jgi:NAD(P)-dependent dehydrogenase (short-subunit alcohol dehydrogenase family)
VPGPSCPCPISIQAGGISRATPRVTRAGMRWRVTERSCSGSLASRAVILGASGASGSTSVAPGPVWTPLIPSSMTPEKVEKFGSNTPLARPGQPVELAPIYVLLASDEASYVSGARVAVTDGRPIL